MLVSGDSDGRNKVLHLSFALVQVTAFVLFALILAVVCHIIYTSMAMSSLRGVIDIQSEQIEAVTAERDEALSENVNLHDEVTQLSVAITQKMDEADRRDKEAAEALEPTGVPLSGTASINDLLDDPDSTEVPGEEAAQEAQADGETEAAEEKTAKGNPIVVFKAENGSLVISSGGGTVASVGADTKFGNVVKIDHGNGYVSIYRNAGTPLVKEGDTVYRGSILFVIGDDNKSLGYQLTKDGAYTDPETLLEIKG